MNQTNDGIYADGNRISIRDSIISDIAWDGKEANAVKIQIGQHVVLDNNELSSNGENIILYAAGAYDNSTYLTVSNGLYPNEITISNNWIYKDLDW